MDTLKFIPVKTTEGTRVGMIDLLANGRFRSWVGRAGKWKLVSALGKSSPTSLHSALKLVAGEIGENVKVPRWASRLA